jgi:hypothetical protein
VVSEGVDGKIVPIRGARALAEAIESYAADRKKLAEASLAAREKARQFSVAKLEERLWQLEKGPFERD